MTGRSNTVNTANNLTSITYNHLNLPKTLTAGSSAITYTYDANGNKLRKVVTGTPALNNDYISGIHYEARVLKFLNTSEGRVVKSASVPGAYNYEYTLEDHLGNGRVYFEIKASNAAAKIQEIDYYGFGLEINRILPSAKNLYMYNGKEKQEHEKLFDYGARFYDPVIGRWNVVDPLAELGRRFSPYNYVENNPMRNIDPDGMWTETANGWSSDNAAEAQSLFMQLQSSRQDERDKGKKKNEEPKPKDDKYMRNGRYTGPGPLESHMTSTERSEYFKGSAEGTAWVMGGEVLSLLRIGRLVPWMTRLLGITEEVGAISYTTVGRWMSASEYATLLKTGKMIEGAGGQTFVTTGGSEAFAAATKGSVYAEFEVATQSLLKGGKEGWYKAIGPSASKAMQSMLTKQGGEILPQVKNLTKILKVK